MDEDRVEHNLIVYARAAYANSTLTIVGTGIHIFMALYGLTVFLETATQQRKGRRRYIVTSFIITALSALSASIDMAQFFQLLFKSRSGHHWIQLVQEARGTWERMLSIAAMGCILLIMDALLVYRCYVMYIEYWWVVILPATTSLAGIVLFFLGNLFNSLQTTSRGVTSKLISASASLTVATNIILTSLIAFRLLQARRRFSQLFPSSDGRLYIGIIAILIESALPLSLFGLVTAVTQQNSVKRRGSLSPAFSVCDTLFTGLFYSFCSLSPHMIIFRVTTGRSFTKFPTAKDDGVLSNPLQFAHQTAESSFLRSTLNREFGRNRDLDPEGGLNTSVIIPGTHESIIHSSEEKEKRSDDGDM